MPKTIKDSNLHEIVTIKEVLTALTEIRQLLKECEPEIDLLDVGVLTGPTVGIRNSSDKKYTRKGTVEVHQAAYISAHNLAVNQYTANIEKRLG